MKWFRNLFKQEKKGAAQKVIASSSGSGTIWSPRDYENFAKEAYLKNVTAFRAIKKIAEEASSVVWNEYKTISDDKREVVTDSPIAKLLKRPNPSDSFSFLMKKIICFYALSGNGFFEKTVRNARENKNLVPIELDVLRPDRMRIEVNRQKGGVKEYVYKVGGEEVRYEVDAVTGKSNVLHLKDFHPTDDWWGASSTEPTAREIDTSNAAIQWNKSILDNQGRPGMIFTIVGDVDVEVMDDLERSLKETHSGPNNAGKNLILTGDSGTSAVPYGWNPTDLDFSEGDLALQRKISMGYGVPPILLGIKGSETYSNFETARLLFWEDTIIPLLNYIKGEINNWLYEEDGFEIDYSLDNVPAFEEKRKMQWERAERSDFLTLNEKREMTGLDPYGPEGDVILVPQNMIPIGASLDAETENDEDDKNPVDNPDSDDNIDDNDGENEKKAQKKFELEGFSESEIKALFGLI